MGKVLTSMKIFPEEGKSLDELTADVQKVQGCNSCKQIEYHFGAKVIQASFVCEDASPIDFEEVVSKISGVSSIQVEEVGLVS